jgi:hypothetical protein
MHPGGMGGGMHPGATGHPGNMNGHMGGGYR